MIIKLNLKDKLKLCVKILKTKGFSDGYTIQELLKDKY